MRIFITQNGLLHIGKDATRRTLCQHSTDGMGDGQSIDVHAVRPLPSGIYCTHCHSTFNQLLVKGVRFLFFQDDIVILRSPESLGVADGLVNYRGVGQDNQAVVYNHKTGAQFQVPYSWLHFRE